jgi:phosphoribosylformylglycinamidine synthase
MDVNVRAVPCRERGMTPPEIMTSESQERMLAIVTPEGLDRVLELCRRWEVRASVVGVVTTGGQLRILDRPDGDVLAEVPAASLHEDAPLYDRPMEAPAPAPAWDDTTEVTTEDAGVDLLDMLGDPSVADPSWAYRQYDHQLFLNTVAAPGGDAAVLRLKAPGLPASERGMALSVDGNHRWCAADPRAGTAMVVAEAALNVACAGATPMAVVNCLNFGNPEHPEVMWQLSEAIDGMGDACRALRLPVIGGNVSLYNESRGRDIDPTPVIGVLGAIPSLERPPPGPVFVDDGAVLLLGDAGARHLGGSRWARAAGVEATGLPALDLEMHGRLLALVAGLVNDGEVVGVHDVADGGLGVALAEMAVRSGVGFEVKGVAGPAELFCEAPSRVVVVVHGGTDTVETRAAEAGIGATVLGRSGGSRLVVDGLVDVDLADAAARWLRRPVD